MIGYLGTYWRFVIIVAASITLVLFAQARIKPLRVSAELDQRRAAEMHAEHVRKVAQDLNRFGAAANAALVDKRAAVAELDACAVQTAKQLSYWELPQADATAEAFYARWQHDVIERVRDAAQDAGVARVIELRGLEDAAITSLATRFAAMRAAETKGARAESPMLRATGVALEVRGSMQAVTRLCAELQTPHADQGGRALTLMDAVIHKPDWRNPADTHVSFTCRWLAWMVEPQAELPAAALNAALKRRSVMAVAPREQATSSGAGAQDAYDGKSGK